MSDPTTASPASSEREDVVSALTQHRELFLVTTQGLSDEQARTTPTVSALSVGGLVKHLNATVTEWLDFVERGPAQDEPVDFDDPDPAVYEAYANGFRLLPDETLADALAEWRAVSERTDALVRAVDLDESHPLPEAPWFPPGEAWTNRRVFLHVLSEISQHAGHADIVREAIDGQKTMG
jgi:hypothetical protein